MPYSITTRDGITLRNIPDDVAPDSLELKARVQKIRAAGPRTGADTIPTAAEAAGGAYVAPQASNEPKPGFIDQAIGTGEAALSVATAPFGMLGQLGGTLKGLAEAILSGQYGSTEAANLVEQSAASGAQALTYAPRTQAGQEQASAVGGVMQNLIPVAGLGGELGALARATGPAVAAGRTAAAATLDKAATAAPRIPPKVAAAVAPTMEPAAVATTARNAATGGLGSKSATKVLAEQAAPDQTIVKSAERLGVQEYLQPDHVTTNEGYRQVAAVLKSSNPGSSLATAERAGLGAVAERAAKLVDDLGGERDLSALDSGVKAQMTGTYAALKKAAGTLYDEVAQEIPAKTEAPATSTLAVIAKRADDLGGAQNLTATERSILQRLSPDDGSQPTYALLDDTRKRLNAAKYGAADTAFSDAASALRDQLLTALREDQKAVATSAGEAIAKKWELAQSTSRAYKGMQDDLSALFGKELDKSIAGGGSSGLSGAVAAVAKGDSSRLTRILSAVPPELRESVVVSGIGTVFRKSAAAGQMDFTSYAKWYDGLRANRQAYAATMAALPLSSRKQLAALYNVSKGVSESLNRRVKTGAINTIRDELLGKDTVLDNLYALAKRSAVAIPAEAASTAVGLPGAGMSAALASALTKGKPRAMLAIDELIASPEFARMVRAAGNSNEQAAAARHVGKSKAFAKFAQAVGNPEELSNREQWLLQSLRPVPFQQQQNERQGATIH